MSTINYSIELRQDFCWRNRNLMGLLAPQERKMFFLPFIRVIPGREYVKNQEIDIPLFVVVEFLQCKPDIDDRTLAEALREGYKAITAATKGNLPYIFKGIKNGNARFALQDCSIFSGIGNKLRCTFNLDEISSYADGRIRDNKPIPLLWYIQCVVEMFFNDNDKAVSNTAYPLCEITTDADGVPVGLLMTIDHEELKKVMGYRKYDYTNIPSDPRDPKANREFFLDFVKFLPQIYELEALQSKIYSETDPSKRCRIDWAIQKHLREQKAFEAKYDNTPIDELHDRYNFLWRRTQHRYQPFIDKVIKPAISELNDGDMLHFCLMENQRKPPRRTKEQIDAGVPIGKAKKEMTYVRNNYEKKKTHKCVATGIVLDAHGKMLKEEHVFAEIDNYKQRKQGGEHTICVDLQHWFSRHSDSKQSRASDTGKLVEESTITPLDEAYDADDVPFTTGETDAQEEFSFCCVEPYEGEELPFPVEEPPQQEMEFYTVEQPYPLGGFQLSLWKNNELPFN